MKYGHLTVLDSIKDIPEDAWYTNGVCGWWSVRDIIGHLASYEHLLIELLTSFLGGDGETPYLDTLAEVGGLGFNDVEVGRRQEYSVQEALDEYNAAYGRVAALVPQIPADTWPEVGTLPWYGPEYALDDFIVYSFYGHKREHSAQINVYRDKLKEEGVIGGGD